MGSNREGTSDRVDSLNGLDAFRTVPVIVRAFLVATVVVLLLAVLGSAALVDWNSLKLGHEGNLPTWFSSIQLFTVALVLAVTVGPDMGKQSRRSLLLVLAPALFLFLSLDEVAMYHEQVGEWLAGDLGIGQGVLSGAWMLVFAPVVAVVLASAAWAYWPYLRHNREAAILMVVGVVAYGVASVGFELLANLVSAGSQVHRALVFAEESGEMISTTAILWGALVVADAKGIRLLVTRGVGQ